MKKSLSESFNIFKSSMLILSSIIGAGLASGQEVVIFFAQYGFISIFFLIILFFLFYYGLNLFLGVGANNYSVDFLKNKKFFKIFEYFSLLIFLIIGSAMLACLNELLNEIIFNFSFPLWSLIAILFSSLFVFLGIKTLLNLSAYIVPFIVFGIIFVCVKGNSVSTISTPAFSSDISNFFVLFLSSISYGCCNLVVSNKLLFTLGNKLTRKQIKWISLIVSSGLVLILGVIAISLLINDEMMLFSELPLIYMSFLISNGVGCFYSIVMFISVLTTLFATQFSFHEVLKLKSKPVKFILSILTFFVLSLFGFSEIVKYLYPVIGGIGFIMIFYLRNLSFKPRLKIADDKIHTAR